MAMDIAKARAERAEAAKAAAAASVSIGKGDADLKKASEQAKKTRKELLDESDE